MLIPLNQILKTPLIFKSAVVTTRILNFSRTRVSFCSFSTLKTQPSIIQNDLRKNRTNEKMAMEVETKTLERVELSLNNWLRPRVLGESWDNIGLLVGSGKFEKNEKVIGGIMLCNDLRLSVLEEAISRKADMIIAYHPPIFSGMKAISYGNWKERLISKCIANDISVYSPHTTLDSTVGGINDRVLNALKTGSNSESKVRAITPLPFVSESDTRGVRFASNNETINQLLSNIPFENFPDILFSVEAGEESATVSVYGKNSLDTVLQLISKLGLTDLDQSEPEKLPPFGAGRILNMNEAVDLDEAVDAIKLHLGLGWVTLAYGGNPKVKSAAVCVGSGSSLLKPIAGKVDLLITGEMSHHDILECVSANSSVVLCTHCSSERHYLPDLVNILKVVTGVSNIFVSEEDCSPLRLVL